MLRNKMPPYLAEIPYGFKNLWEITVSALTFEPPQIIAENITEVNLNGATVTTQQLITLYDWNRDLCAVHLTGGDPYLVTLTGYHREGNISFRLFLQAGGGGGGSSDHRLLTHRSDSDQHPISAITGLSAALNTKYELPSGGIPATDLASAVQTNLGKANTALQPSALNDYRTASAQNTIDASKLDVFQGTTHSGKIMTINSSGNVVPGIKFDPDSKTANMTQSVGIDSNGKLYTEPGGGGSSISPYTSNPKALGTASPGISTNYSRGDHVHPKPTPSDIGAIAAPANPATGAFLTYNGSAWVAQTLSVWQGGSY